MFKLHFSVTHILLVLGTMGDVHVARPGVAQHLCVTVVDEWAQYTVYS